MKQLITYFLLVITVSIHAQKNLDADLEGTWYISMIGVNFKDTSIYRIPNEKAAITFGDLLEQKLNSPRFYIRNPKPYYVEYSGTIDHQGSVYLYKTESARRKRTDPITLEYVLEKDQLVLIEEETAGISNEGSGFPVYDKLTVLTRIYDSLSWNKHILGAWNCTSDQSFFDLKTGDTCRFTKANFQKDNQLRFDLNAAFSTCKIKENQKTLPVQSNSVLDGVYLGDKWFSYRFIIDLKKNQITFLLGSSEITFKILELTNDSLILVKS